MPGIPGGTVLPTGLNDRGQVVGRATAPNGVGGDRTHAFLYADGAMIDLGTLGGTEGSHALAVNESGSVVGWAYTADEHPP